MTDDEIVAQVSGEHDLLESESEDEPKGCPTVSHTRVYEAFGIAVQWLESQGTDPAHLMLVKKWMTSAGRKQENSLTQTEITQYFNPIVLHKSYGCCTSV